jgi:hypothetical protein
MLLRRRLCSVRQEDRWNNRLRHIQPVFKVDKDAVSLQVLSLPVREVGDVQGVLVVKPDARLAPIFQGLLSGVLVSYSELFLSA